MTKTEELEFEILFGDFIASHKMTVKEIEKFQDDMMEMIEDICNEKIDELEAE